MTTLADHIDARRRDYQHNAENMRRELRALAAFLCRIDSDLDESTTEQVSRHMEEVQTQARRMERTLARYTETRAALGALLNLESAQN
jgi:anti-sigma factor RsiW